MRRHAIQVNLSYTYLDGSSSASSVIARRARGDQPSPETSPEESPPSSMSKSGAPGEWLLLSGTFVKKWLRC